MTFPYCHKGIPTDHCWNASSIPQIAHDHHHWFSYHHDLKINGSLHGWLRKEIGVPPGNFSQFAIENMSQSLNS